MLVAWNPPTWLYLDAEKPPSGPWARRRPNSTHLGFRLVKSAGPPSASWTLLRRSCCRLLPPAHPDEDEDEDEEDDEDDEGGVDAWGGLAPAFSSQNCPRAATTIRHAFVATRLG